MADILEFDELQMYYGEPYSVNGYLTLTLPTVGDIVEFGERKYYGMIHSITCIPSDMKSQLDDMGIDYEEISDFELFAMLIQTVSNDICDLLFSEIDEEGKSKPFSFDGFKYGIHNATGKPILYKEETEQIFDELSYLKLVGYLRKAHNITPKVEKAANKTTKKILIDLDRQKIKENASKPYHSQLKPLISAMMRYPGFKYKSRELKECCIYEFMDTISGAQIYVHSTALLQGSYSGMIDTSKIKKKEFNWMRGVNDD